jgi:hypothetical protein
MVTFLITSVLLLGLVAIAIYFWQKHANTSQTTQLPPPSSPQVQGLFSDFKLNELRAATVSKPVSEIDEQIDREDFENAIAAIRDFQHSPNRSSTTRLLHVAALSDDAKTYARAIELVLMSWREGSLSGVSAKDLQALISSEYWLLSSHTRTSGAGFVLKETLSSANRELESGNPN